MPRTKLRTAALQADLLKAAVGLVEGDRRDVTARAVATAAGTSTAAVYELFGDKAGLLRAVFAEAFRLLHQELAAVPVTDQPRQDLVALLAAARRFARARPALFELMVSRPYAELDPEPDDVAAAAEIQRLVLRAVGRAQRAGLLGGDRRDVAHVLVAVNRGLVAAELAGTAGSTAANVERRWRLGIDAVLDGLTRKAP